MAEKKGWISLHRKIEDWEFYLSEPFTKSGAWIDLILLACHEGESYFIRGNLIEVSRGELAWSEKKLATRWQWSRDKVRSFLKLLETRQQIKINKSFIINKIILLNYDQYQYKPTADQTAEPTADQTHTTMTNNVNKVAPSKKKQPFIDNDPVWVDEKTGIVKVKIHTGEWKIYEGSKKDIVWR